MQNSMVVSILPILDWKQLHFLANLVQKLQLPVKLKIGT